MTNPTKWKVALALAGLVLFGAGVRLDQSRLRLAGIAVVAAAWTLRFIRPQEKERP